MERNSIASAATPGKGGDVGGSETSERRRGRGRGFSACHLSISLGRCGSVTRRVCDDRQPFPARAAPARSPLATTRARAAEPFKARSRLNGRARWANGHHVLKVVFAAMFVKHYSADASRN